MCRVVSLCEITHRGLHAWKWTRGGGVLLKSGRETVKSEGRGPLHVHWGGSRNTYFMHH